MSFAKIIIGFAFLVASTAFARDLKEIHASEYLYVGSPGDVVTSLESKLVREAARVCGGEDKVAGVTSVAFHFSENGAFTQPVRFEGKPGGRYHESQISMVYPQGEGSAEVECR